MYLPLHIDKSADVALQDQLYSQLRDLIVTSWLKPDSRVIATRFLAEQIGVSRTTILLAYERLISEGYLETRPAVGTFVCSILPETAPKPMAAAAMAAVTRPEAPVAAAAVRQSTLCPPATIVIPWGPGEPAPIDFGCGLPDPALFPLKAWKRLTQTALDRSRLALVHNPPPAGVLPLRAAIADWLTMKRGVVVAADQVVVISGRQQAYDIAARLFLPAGGRVVVEGPSDAWASTSFQNQGARLVAVPVDRHGMDVAQLPEGKAALVHVTPSHQTLLGGTLSVERRRRLIEWARQTGAYIIEDDCDGDFRYNGISPPPIMALDPYGLVIHTGSFSKSLGAGLRLGYMVLPPELCEAAVAVKSLLDCGNPWIEQTVLAEFIASGEYDRHLRRIRKTYMDRRECLIEALHQHFATVELIGADAGTRLTWLLPDGFPTARCIRDRAREQGVGVHCLEPADGPSDFTDKALLLGYSHLGEATIREGIALLARALRPQAFH